MKTLNLILVAITLLHDYSKDSNTLDRYKQKGVVNKAIEQQTDFFEAARKYDSVVNKSLPYTGTQSQLRSNDSITYNAGYAPMQQMPNRSKYDNGIMEGQDLNQYRQDQREAERQETSMVIIKWIILTAPSIVIVFILMLRNKKSTISEK